MNVLKFGGTSVATPERIEQVLDLVERARARAPVAVVVSAFAGVTNALIDAAAAASAGDDRYRAVFDELAARHHQAAETLAAPAERTTIAAEVTAALEDLSNLYRGSRLLRECSPRTHDSIVSYGERLSALIIAAAARRRGLDGDACDARALIRTDTTFGYARVLQPVTDERIREHFASRERLQIVTGFIASSLAGETTTLGRGGSDYTAALVGAALGATAIEIWTDVDGVMSADPRQVAGAFSLDCLSYDELMELSHFGAKVVYPPTIHPARQRSIPLVILNTFNPAFPGTRVTEAGGPNTFPLRGISSINRVALARLEGDGMVGVPGIAERLFAALARGAINVILISQASSEHSICFAIPPDAVGGARDLVDREFALERQAGLIDPLVVDEDVSLIAVVGAGMHERPGVAGQLFAVLGAHRINVRAISQGSSELNISLAVSRSDEPRALNAIHAVFFAPRRTSVALYLVGPGRVGSALLDQVAERAAALEREEGLTLRVAAVASSRRMAQGDDALTGPAWRVSLDAGEPADLTALVRAMVCRDAGRAVFVDCTADPEVPRFYTAALEAGIPVVSANKRPFAGPLDKYRALVDAARRTSTALLHEATVGAGLPVLSTLTELVRTGDRVLRIDGVLSGTLAFLMDRLAGGASFSAAVEEAHALGFTEPDPRDDLGGQDVARKLLILARLAGFDLESEAVTVEPLLSVSDAPWSTMSLEEFWQALPELDAPFAARHRAAAAAGRRLAYVATVDGRAARVGLDEVDGTHPCSPLRGSDNLIAFYTSRYATPLVVRGPGAGPAVTAAGIFGDVLRAAHRVRFPNAQ